MKFLAIPLLFAITFSPPLWASAESTYVMEIYHSYYFDIRRERLPTELRNRSEHQEGIKIYKCYLIDDGQECYPLVGGVVLTIEELRKLLIRHNVAYVSGALALLTGVFFVAKGITVVGVAGLGAGITAIIGMQSGLTVSSAVPIMAGVTFIVVGRYMGQGASRVGWIMGSGFLGGGVVSGTLELLGIDLDTIRDWIRPRLLSLKPKVGPVLRKILSEKDVLMVSDVDSIEQDFMEIFDIILSERVSQ